MDYFEWNETIASSIFNDDSKGKDVYLFLTRADIIELGKSKILNKSKDEIWRDYVDSLINAPFARYRTASYISKLDAVWRYTNRIKRYSPEKFIYPFYIAFLIPLILPFTEYTGQFGAHCYYDPLNSFLLKEGLPHMPTQNPDSNWLMIWEDLEEWTIVDKDMEWGIFEIRKFGHSNWKYVSIPLSQCLLSRNSLKKIDQLFVQYEILPNQNLSDKFIRQLLIDNKTFLGIADNIIGFLRDKNSELGNSVISIAKKYYDKWTGESFIESTYLKSSKVGKGYTLSNLKLCLHLNKLEENVETYFRVYSKTEFPGDLLFSPELKCDYELNGFSQPLKTELGEKLVLQDNLNRWKSIFILKQIHVLVPGRLWGLSDWVESDYLLSNTDCLLLASNPSLNEIIEWLKLSSDRFSILKIELLLEGYSLIEVKNIREPFNEYNLCFEKVPRKLLFFEGLKIDSKSYLNKLPPKVKVEESSSEYSLELNYLNSPENISLVKSIDELPLWDLPNNIREFREFDITLKVKDADIHFIRGKLSPSKINLLDPELIPKRDKFGRVISNIDDITLQGNYFIGDIMDVKSNIHYRQMINHFYSELNPDSLKFSIDHRFTVRFEKYEDLLLHYMSSRGALGFEDYYNAFEIIYKNIFANLGGEANLAVFKKSSLRYYENLGFIDIDYINKKIFVNEPSIILVPNYWFTGRKGLLIGARSEDFIKKLIDVCRSSGVKVSKASYEGNIERFLLPSTIYLDAPGDSSNNYGENKLIDIASSLNIKYNFDYFFQVALLLFSASIDDYNSILRQDIFDADFDWKYKLFDPIHYTFQGGIPEMDKTYSLVQYELTPHDIRHKLWINGHSYGEGITDENVIDKNWGRYLVLKNKGINCIYEDIGKNSIAVPSSLTFPRLIAKGLTLMSGKAPSQMIINSKYYNVYENLSHSFLSNLLELKLNQKLININLG